MCYTIILGTKTKKNWPFNKHIEILIKLSTLHDNLKGRWREILCLFVSTSDMQFSVPIIATILRTGCTKFTSKSCDNKTLKCWNTVCSDEPAGLAPWPLLSEAEWGGPYRGCQRWNRSDKFRILKKYIYNKNVTFSKTVN